MYEVLVSANKPTDEELMREFQNGDPDAFATIYSRYRTRIFSFLARQHGNRENAGDLMQEVFIRAIRGARAFQHGSRFSTWIYTIARNLLIDETRKAKFRKHASLDQKIGTDGPALMERLASNGPTPDRSAASERLREDLARTISALPEDQREVFLLREYHGFPFREIAKIVNAKEGTVKSRMRYALETLRRELEDYSDYARSLP